MTENTYWNCKGKYQDKYEPLFQELVPKEGPAKSLQGEVLRAASRIYYRYYNDGEIVTYNTQKIKFSSIENAWGFLHELKFDYRDAMLDTISFLMEALAKCHEVDVARLFLEAMMDLAIGYAQTRPLVPFDGDMLDSRYAEHCEEVCNLYDEEDDDD